MELCGDSEPAAGVRNAARRILGRTREGWHHGANQESVNSWLSGKNKSIEKHEKEERIQTRGDGGHPIPFLTLHTDRLVITCTLKGLTDP